VYWRGRTNGEESWVGGARPSVKTTKSNNKNLLKTTKTTEGRCHFVGRPESTDVRSRKNNAEQRQRSDKMGKGTDEGVKREEN